MERGRAERSRRLMRKLQAAGEGMDVLTILFVVMVSQVHPYVKTSNCRF